MAAGTKKIVLNREADWLENGLSQNLYFEGDSLTLDNKNARHGFYISTSIDSMEAETIWDRVRIVSNIKKDALLRLRFYVSDSLNVRLAKNAAETIKVNLDEYIKDESIPFNTRFNVLDKLEGYKEFDNPNDILLYSQKGRYLWFSVEIANYGLNKIMIESMKIEFPRASFVEYLPDIYHSRADKDSFLARFIGVFESIYLDIEEKIDNMPRMFDPMLVNTEFFSWLTSWFSIKDNYIWGEDKLRLILKNIMRLYAIKGTKDVIREIVWIYTGCKAKVVEQFEITNNDIFADNKELLFKLFGENGYTFTVIVGDSGVKDSDEYLALLKLINLFKPVDSICNLVSLSNNIYLDYHCYLGLNSYISHNKQMVLDDGSIIMDSTFLTETK